MANTKRKRPARTPEGRMNQLIDLAVDNAEERLRNGTASSQIISLLLGLATTKAQLEIEKLKADVQLQTAKVKQIEDTKNIRELYDNAINALKDYQGNRSFEEEAYYEDY